MLNDTNQQPVSLDKLVNFYVDTCITTNNIDVSNITTDMLEDVKRSSKTSIRENIKQEIISELTNEEYEKIKSDANDRLNSERTTSTLKHLTSMLVEGGLLAFIVGLLVNQITNWISIGIHGSNELYWTIGISLTLFIIIVVIYLTLFIKNVISFIENKDNHEYQKK